MDKRGWILLILFIVHLPGYSQQLNDPTKPPAKEAPKKTVETEILRVKAIKVDSKGNHSATINDEVVLVGQWYADAKVIKIEKNLVTLRGPKGEIIKLKLYRNNHLKCFFNFSIIKAFTLNNL